MKKYQVDIHAIGLIKEGQEDLLANLRTGFEEGGEVHSMTTSILAGKLIIQVVFYARTEAEAQSLIARALYHAREHSLTAGVLIPLTK